MTSSSATGRSWGGSTMNVPYMPRAMCSASGPPALSCGGVAGEWHGGRGRGAVDEPHPQHVALPAPQRWAGDASVEGPRREPHAGRDLDLLVLGDDLPL